MARNDESRKKLLFLVQFSILLAIEAIVCFTPLGSIPIPPLVATLGMVPVIITAILLGTGPGAVMGFFAGLFSFIVWTFMPPSPMAFVFTPFYSVGEVSGNFWSLVICFAPRILVGVVAGVSFQMLSRVSKNGPLVYGLSGVLGSLTNTFLVLGGIVLFFGQDYASVLGVSMNILLGLIGGTILTNGIPEAVVSAVAAYAVCRPLRRYSRNPNAR